MTKGKFIRYLLAANAVVICLVVGLGFLTWNFINTNSAAPVETSKQQDDSRQRGSSLVLGLQDTETKLLFAHQQDSTIRILDFVSPSEHKELFSFNSNNFGYPLSTQLDSVDQNNIYFLEESLNGDALNRYSNGRRNILYTSPYNLTGLHVAGEVVYLTAKQTFDGVEFTLLLRWEQNESVRELTRFQSNANIYVDSLSATGINLTATNAQSCYQYSLTESTLNEANCQNWQQSSLNKKYRLVKEIIFEGETPESYTQEQLNYRYFVYLESEYRAYQTEQDKLDQGDSEVLAPKPRALYQSSANQDVDLVYDSGNELVLVSADRFTQAKQLVTVKLRDNYPSQIISLPLADSVEFLGANKQSSQVYFSLDSLLGQTAYSSLHLLHYENQVVYELHYPACKPGTHICKFIYL